MRKAASTITRRKFASMTLLSIMIPISLLALSRLIGVLPEPQIPETITLETVNWKLDRPLEDVRFDNNIRNIYIDDFVSVNLTLIEYYDNYDWNGLDFLMLRVSFAGSLSAVATIFRPIDTASALDISENFLGKSPAWPTAVANMTITGVEDAYINDVEAYVKAKATGIPSRLIIFAYWVFYDVLENNKDHMLEMSLEATYFDGTGYRKIIAPIVLEVAC